MFRRLLTLAVFASGSISFAQSSKLSASGQAPRSATPPASGEAKQLSFCFWNVENLFDDRDDKRNSVDEPYDNAFSHNDKLRQLHYDHTAQTLLKMNGGHGPDIIACAEVESIRAAEILMGTLNKFVKNPNDKYKHILMKNLDAGRHISTCVITRIDVSNLSTRLHGGNLRILETHVYANGYDLCILATHWTSKLKQEGGGQGESGRSKYANTIYGVYERLAEKNPATDFLVCGDFNDTPDSPQVVEGLHATGDRKKLSKTGRNSNLLDLFANKDPNKFGTIWYQGKPLIYDHICVSPGMLDSEGWSCDPDSARTWTDGLIRPGSTRREPWRFGDPNRNDLRESERGYSDHFPVLVTLKVAAKK